MKQRVLFLCTHNSARSQMAEGLLRHMGEEQLAVYRSVRDAIRSRIESELLGRA